MPARPTYIVTGGAGFIGSNLVATLLARSPRPVVTIVENFRSGSFANLVEACARAGVGPFDGAVLAESTASIGWARVLDEHRPRAVFHIGAITDTTHADEATMIRENVAGFGELLAAAHERSIRVAYASSAATYGTIPHTARRLPFPESAAGAPNNVYGFSKWLMENVHRRFMGEHPDAKVVGLRYFNVFGPGESRKGKMASMTFQLTGQLLAGERPRLFADGSQARDQVWIEDVVAGTLAAAGLDAKADPTPGIYNMGSGVAVSFNQMLEAIRGAIGISGSKRPTEYFEMPASIREFYQDYTCADMSAAAGGLGFKPSHAPLEAIGRYAKWMSK